MVMTQALLLSPISLSLLIVTQSRYIYFPLPDPTLGLLLLIVTHSRYIYSIDRLILSEVSRCTISYCEFYPVWKEDVPFNILKTRPTHTKITTQRCTLRLPRFNISIPEKKSFSLEWLSYFVVYDVPFCHLILVSSK